jgi:hypothetical protein
MFRGAAYSYFALLVLAGFAFWPLYLSRLGTGIDPYTHWHAFLAVCWCTLLIAQPLLLPKHRQAHRRLGAVSYMLAPAFAIASLLLAHARFHAMEETKFQQDAANLFLPLSAICLFASRARVGRSKRCSSPRRTAKSTAHINAANRC